MNVKLFNPQSVNSKFPVIVVECNGERFWVTANGGWEKRIPYRGPIAKDPIPVCLRGLAWSLGVPGWENAECPA